MASIQEECARRNIDRLFHFTPIEHLSDILKYGLMTPQLCDLMGFDYKANDEYRFDGQDAICLSIEWPNYKLFYSFRKRDESRRWVVLQLPVDILWQKRCCFNTTNAADGSMSGLTFEARCGHGPFMKLFEDYADKERAKLGIPPYLPTNPQAEVLCLDMIEAQYIQRVYFDD